MNLAVLKILLWMSVIVGMTGVLLLAGIILTKVDPRMAGLFDTERFKNFGLLGWASRLGIAERIVYWMAAYNVFEMYPFWRWTWACWLLLPNYCARIWIPLA